MVGHVSTSTMFQRFMHSQVVGALILIAMTVIALIWANSAWGAILLRPVAHLPGRQLR